MRNDHDDVRVGLLGFGTVGQGLVQGINLQINNISRRLGAGLKIQRALVMFLMMVALTVLYQRLLLIKNEESKSY